ncbi:hypothetical protein [Bradyrhizobium sp. USDA 3315]
MPVIVRPIVFANTGEQPGPERYITDKQLLHAETLILRQREEMAAVSAASDVGSTRDALPVERRCSGMMDAPGLFSAQITAFSGC